MRIQAPDLTTLWHGAMKKMWYGTLENGGLDFVASIDTIAYDNLLATPSMAYDFDMGRDLWLTKQRWTMLLRQYLDPQLTENFINQAIEIGRKEGKRGVVVSMPNRPVIPGRKKHRWGNCMAAFTYRGLAKDGPVLGLHSRVSYIAYIGGLDLALAAVLARTIGEETGVPLEETGFRWYIDALQFHGFKSLPLLYRTEYVGDLSSTKKRRKYPTIRLVGSWWDKIVRAESEGKSLEEEKYGPLRRVRRRYEEWQREEYQPAMPLEKLTLDPLWRR